MKLLDIPLGLIINFNVLKLSDGVSRLILPGANTKSFRTFSVSSVLSCSIRVTRSSREREWRIEFLRSVKIVNGYKIRAKRV